LPSTPYSLPFMAEGGASVQENSGAEDKDSQRELSRKAACRRWVKGMRI